MTDNEIIKALECRMPFDNVCVLAYDLINRQRAEIERLKSRNDELNALNKTASIEAIKEFWNRAKQTVEFRTCPYVYIMDGDNLVKEMVGVIDG